MTGMALQPEFEAHSYTPANLGTEESLSRRDGTLQ
jgi:hypothetical protein